MDEKSTESLIVSNMSNCIEDYIVGVELSDDNDIDYFVFKFICGGYLIYEIRFHWMNMKNGLDQFGNLPKMIQKMQDAIEDNGRYYTIDFVDISVRISGDRIIFSNINSDYTQILFKINKSIILAFKQLYNWFVYHRMLYEKAPPSKSLVENTDEGFNSPKYFGHAFNVVIHPKMVLPEIYEPQYEIEETGVDDSSTEDLDIIYEDGFVNYWVDVTFKAGLPEDNCIFTFVSNNIKIFQMDFHWMDMKDSLKNFGDLPRIIIAMEEAIQTGYTFIRTKYINGIEFHICKDILTISEIKTHYTTFYFKINESLVTAFKKLYNWYMKYRKVYKDSEPALSRDDSTLPVTYKAIPKIDLPLALRPPYKIV
jgi:hypothetical protein